MSVSGGFCSGVGRVENGSWFVVLFTGIATVFFSFFAGIIVDNK